MMKSTLIATALAAASSAYGMPVAPLPVSDGAVIEIRQGCGLGRQLFDGLCVSNSAVRAAVRRCQAKRMRMVNGRCEPVVRPITASKTAPASKPVETKPAAPAASPATTAAPSPAGTQPAASAKPGETR